MPSSSIQKPPNSNIQTTKSGQQSMEQMAIDPIAITNEVIYTDDVEIDDIVIRPSKQN